MIKYLMALYLILGAAIISAQNWCFERNDELLNPYNIHTKGMNTPFTGDFDDDGDFDLIVGCRGGVLQYYENIGTPDSAIWQMDEDYFRTVVLDTSYAPQPSLVDLDGDGLDELYLSYSDGYIDFITGRIDRYINTGNQNNPVWEISDFEFDSTNTNYFYPQFVDFDHDGDYDLLLSGNHWVGDYPYYYENIGDSTSYSFQLNNSIFENLPFDDVGEFFAFNLSDIEGDSKYELLIILGQFDVDDNDVYLYSNIGSETEPIWQEDRYWYRSHYITMLSFADIDGDSDKDMFVGNSHVPLYFNENIGTPDSISLKYQFNGEQQGPLFIDLCENIHFVDFDNDDDDDFIFLYRWRTIWEGNYAYGSYANIGNQQYPIFDNTDGFGGLGPIYFSNNIYLTSGDLNGDNYPEIATHNPAYTYFINQSGERFSPDSSCLFDLEDDYYYYPELADFNNDGLTDLLVRRIDTLAWMFYENIGNILTPQWQSQPNWSIDTVLPLRKIRAANLNRDNKLDLVGICANWYLCGFINTGSQNRPEFTYDPIIFLGWELQAMPYFDCADLDGDGDDDIILNNDGVIEFIENKTTTDITDPEPMLPENTALLQNYPNPFNASTVISFTLDKPGEVMLTVYDILGRQVEMLFNQKLQAGEHKITWTPGNDLPSGIFFYKLTTSEKEFTNKMIMIK